MRKYYLHTVAFFSVALCIAQVNPDLLVKTTEAGEQTQETITVDFDSEFSNDGTFFHYEFDVVMNQTSEVGAIQLEQTLSLSEKDPTKNFWYKNSGEINLWINAHASEVKAEVFNLLGQSMTPQVIDIDNNKTHIFYTPDSDGLYIVKFQVNDKYGVAKLLVAGVSDGIPDIAPSILLKSSKHNFNDETLRRLANTYTISATSQDWVEDFSESIQIENNNTQVVEITSTPKTGDFAINTKLGGFGTSGTKIKAEILSSGFSREFTTSTSQQIFWNVPLPTNPTEVKISVEDDMVNPNEAEFLSSVFFIDIYKDIDGEINGAIAVDLNEIPNEVDLSVVVRHYQTTNVMSGVTVELRNDSDDSLIDTQVTDVNGVATFQDVPGQTTVYTVVDKTDDTVYKKTNESYTTKLVNTVGKMSDTINTTAVPKVFYVNTTQVPIVDVMGYKVQNYNVEFLRYSDEIYLPVDGMKSTVVSHLEGFATGVGYPNAFDFSAIVPFGEPTIEQINQYEIFAPDRTTFDGLIGTDGEYFGTSTTNAGKFASNGKIIYFRSSNWDLNGTQEDSNHHEAGNKLNIPFRTGASSRNPSAAENTPLTELDALMIKLWYNIGDNIYIRVDAHNRPLDYSHTVTLED